MDLVNPQTEEQEAENAAYIARECKRIQATWTARDERARRGNPQVPEVTVTRVHLPHLQSFDLDGMDVPIN